VWSSDSKVKHRHQELTALDLALTLTEIKSVFCFCSSV